jgi:hypothetical protein
MVDLVDVFKVVQSYKLRADFKGALARLLEDNVGHAHSRSRKNVTPLSVRTQELRARALCKAFEDFRQGGHAIQSLYRLEAKHVQLLVEIWLAQGRTSSTIDNKLTHLRALAQWIARPGLVTTLADYVDLEKHGWSSPDASGRKMSFSGDGIDAVAVIEDIARTDAHIAAQLKLQAVFDLGVKESFVFRPKDAARCRDFLAIVRGLKGSCLRVVSSEVKLAVLSEAAGLADQYTGTTMRDRLTK